MEQQEINLIERAQGGDTQAFDALVRMHDRRVLQVAYAMLNHLHDAQDVYQETFLRAYSKIATYRFESSFSTWLLKIAVNLSINRRKQRKRRQWFSLEEKGANVIEHHMSGGGADPSSTEKQVASNEFQQHVAASLEALSEQERAVFTLKHFQGYKISEIAKMISCAEGTVKNYLFRATQKLKKQLTPIYQQD
ncbi:MAG: RNA polymerase sigma factor [Deferribacteres bacterium]|nr:RNA polymerase sigma factor [candidate division KSB1 bacterium]MCB9509822.1 RNA polymerase sigma factor [Deferribacteres bacterium]